MRAPRSGSGGAPGAWWLCRSPKGVSAPAAQPGRCMVRDATVAAAHRHARAEVKGGGMPAAGPDTAPLSSTCFQQHIFNNMP